MKLACTQDELLSLLKTQLSNFSYSEITAKEKEKLAFLIDYTNKRGGGIKKIGYLF